MPFFAYQRISKDAELTGEGVDRQRHDCAALAASLGWTDLTHLTDNNRSAWQRQVRRPQFQALLEHIRSGTAEGIVIYHLDRLLRRTDELEMLIAAVESVVTSRRRNPCPIHSTSGIIDLSNPDGRFAARILTAVSQKESDDKSRRIRAQRAHSKRAGNQIPLGRRTFGFHADSTIIPAEATAILAAAATITNGGTMAGIAMHRYRLRFLPFMVITPIAMPEILLGDARALPLPDASVDLIVTSPPYFSLRTYTDGGGACR